MMWGPVLVKYTWGRGPGDLSTGGMSMSVQRVGGKDIVVKCEPHVGGERGKERVWTFTCGNEFRSHVGRRECGRSPHSDVERDHPAVPGEREHFKNHGPGRRLRCERGRLQRPAPGGCEGFDGPAAGVHRLRAEVEGGVFDRALDQRGGFLEARPWTSEGTVFAHVVQSNAECVCA